MGTLSIIMLVSNPKNLTNLILSTSYRMDNEHEFEALINQIGFNDALKLAAIITQGISKTKLDSTMLSNQQQSSLRVSLSVMTLLTSQKQS